ncbi:LPD7 domain-containing protein [Herbaspirillum sp. SJZ107]|uniref:LPD7 domain-containing protein n=1 Tax=Herbaspirillum sp. SJZ107 TaxID=2572881 RepID=UPI00114EB302|nr:LPD7 domain-containing protein [Herbaspirillum sp. SJZ107]TQK07820.1 hypothetical protein FBX97_3109 [Herbaspirillum sp. SJZ107]
MSTRNDDKQTLPLPGVADDQSAGNQAAEDETGLVSGLAKVHSNPALQALRDTPPMDGRETLPPHDANAKSTRKARSAKTSSPDASSTRKATQITENDGRPANAKRTSTRRSTDVVLETEAETSKPKRKSRAKSAQMPTADVGHPGPRLDIPNLTPEAMSFLADQDAKAADLFKLSTESQAFVQYHLKQMHSLEQNSQLTNALLRASARPVSPAFEKFVDALTKVAGEKLAVPVTLSMPKTEVLLTQETGNLPVASYAPRREGVGMYAPVTVQLRSIDINTNTLDVAPPVSMGVSGNVKTKSRRGGENDVPIHLENSIERETAPLRVSPVVDVPQHGAIVEPSNTSKANDESIPLSGSNLGRNFMWSVVNWILWRRKDQLPSMHVHVTSEVGGAMSVAARAPVDKNSTAVPDAVIRRFLKVEQQYYFPDKSLAFIDHGNKLATHGVHPEVVRSLVEIAKTRGWDSITVKGAEEFRRSTWMEAAHNGLKVAGYQPSKLDLAELANKPVKNTVEKSSVKDKNTSDFFAHQRTVSNDPKEFSKAAVKGADDLTNQGASVSSELAEKAKSFANEKATFVVKKYPDLAGAYGLIEAAKSFAGQNLPESARDEFVGMARRHVIQKIAVGEQVTGPKIFTASTRIKESTEQRPSAKSVDLGKSQKIKQPTKER